MFMRLMWITIIMAVSRASCDPSVIQSSKLQKPEQQVIWSDLEPEIPDHCRDQVLCEDVPNYPHEYIDHLLQNNATVRMGDNVGAKRCPEDDNSKLHELCASITKVTAPKAAQNTDGRWFYVLSGQIICLKLCKDNGGPCSQEFIHVYSGYNATCKQTFTRTQMTIIDENRKVDYINIDTIPTGCSCKISEN